MAPKQAMSNLGLSELNEIVKICIGAVQRVNLSNHWKRRRFMVLHAAFTNHMK